MEDGEAVALPRAPEQGPKASTGRERRFTLIHFSLLDCAVRLCDMKNAGPEGPAASVMRENGGAEAPPVASGERRHLHLGRLAADGLAGLLGLPLEGLPALADDLFVGCDGALSRHAQGVGL